MTTSHAWLPPALAVVLGIGGCSCDGVQPAVVDGAAQATASATTTPAAELAPVPWAPRFARRCTEWGHDVLLGTERHVFACNGAVYDAASGELVHVMEEMAFPAGAVGSVSLWVPSGGADLVVWEGIRPQGTIEVPAQLRGLVPSPDRRLLLAVAVDQAYTIDPTRRSVRRVPGADACANAHAVGFSIAGDVRCVVRCGEDEACLSGPGVEPTRLSFAARAARFDPRGGRVLVVGEDEARWLDGDGGVLGSHPVSGSPTIIAASSEGEMLVTGEPGTELWRLEDGRTVVETVYPGRAHDAVFAAGHIVLSVATRSVVWLHRGEPAAPPELPVPAPPPGFEALAADRDGDAPSFEGAGTVLNRALADVAAFDRGAPGFAHVIVSRSDAAELARFADDDAAWARMVAARYVEPGAQRWARWWRDAQGRRVVRGHTYIGGCERTHIDVRVEERDGWLERWVVYTADGEAEDALGPLPGGSTEIAEARSDRYPGDPSIGPR